MCLTTLNAKQKKHKKPFIAYKLAEVSSDGFNSPYTNVVPNPLYYQIGQQTVSDRQTHDARCREYGGQSQAEREKMSGQVVHGIHLYASLNAARNGRHRTINAIEGTIWGRKAESVFVILRCRVEPQDVIAYGHGPWREDCLVADKVTTLNVASVFSSQSTSAAKAFEKSLKDDGTFHPFKRRYL